MHLYAANLSKEEYDNEQILGHWISLNSISGSLCYSISPTPHPFCIPICFDLHHCTGVNVYLKILYRIDETYTIGAISARASMFECQKWNHYCLNNMSISREFPNFIMETPNNNRAHVHRYLIVYILRNHIWRWS